MLHDKKMIGDKKFDRLKRNTELTDDELAAFVQRQLTETQQSTKALAQLLQEIYPEAEIVYSKAGNVSEFRQEFGLLKCREVNDLHHAKNAYLNIVVGNVYKTKFTDRFFLNIRKENYSLKKVFDWDTPGAWKADGTSIATVKKYMAKNNPIITRMPREENGLLFKQTIMPAGKGQIRIKADKPIEKYGGYTSRFASHFIVVEHQRGRKRVRTIEPVYIYGKTLFKNNPVKYCTQILQLTNPSVVYSPIYIDSTLELNGERLTLTGGTASSGDGRDLYNHTVQLAVDDQKTKWIKSILKYLERCSEQRKEIPVTPFDGVDSEKNKALYDFFLKKLSSNCYGKLFTKEGQVLAKRRDDFSMLPVAAQCRIIAEVLKLFTCTAELPNLKELCGSAISERIRKSANISGLNSAYLIHQSPTGLYEYRTDLLH